MKNAEELIKEEERNKKKAEKKRAKKKVGRTFTLQLIFVLISFWKSSFEDICRYGRNSGPPWIFCFEYGKSNRCQFFTILEKSSETKAKRKRKESWR